MADIKINKNHGGKEFTSSFHFVGKVKPFAKFQDGSRVEQPIYIEDTTKNGKPQRRIQFVIETAEHNELKLENRGYVVDKIYAYSREHKKTASVKWLDDKEARYDKSKLPDDTYHYMQADWDLLETLSEVAVPGNWVEVRGEYEFDSFFNNEGNEVKLIKRIVTSAYPIEDGAEIKHDRKVIVPNYVTDFKSDDFVEVNKGHVQFALNSAYRPEDEKDVKVNAYFLSYGKERSKVSEFEAKVPHVEPGEGRISLADAFAGNLSKFDFVEAKVEDYNTAVYSEVPVEEENLESDPFALVDETLKEVKTKRAVSGTRKGLEIVSIVSGSHVKGMLTEDDVKPPVPQNDGDSPFADEKLDTSTSIDDPFAPAAGLDPDDPFA